MKLGRNDPCHCGSGKKYKHCHYEEDRAKEADDLRVAAEERARSAAEAEPEEEPKSKKSDNDGSRFLPKSHVQAQRGSRGATNSRTTRGSQRGG